MNIYYIRAAIYAATNIYLSLEDTKRYLIEEGLVTPKQAARLIFVGYNDYHGGAVSDEAKEPPDDLPLVILDDDVVSAIEVALDGI